MKSSHAATRPRLPNGQFVPRKKPPRVLAMPRDKMPGVRVAGRYVTAWFAALAFAAVLGFVAIGVVRCVSLAGPEMPIPALRSLYPIPLT